MKRKRSAAARLMYSPQGWRLWGPDGKEYFFVRELSPVEVVNLLSRPAVALMITDGGGAQWCEGSDRLPSWNAMVVPRLDSASPPARPAPFPGRTPAVGRFAGRHVWRGARWLGGQAWRGAKWSAQRSWAGGGWADSSLATGSRAAVRWAFGQRSCL
jgi:hypothetical protein